MTRAKHEPQTGKSKMTHLTHKNGSQAQVVEKLTCSEKRKLDLVENGWKPEIYLIRFERRTRKGMKSFLGTAQIGHDGAVVLMYSVAE